eukprot:scaffold5524_cov56-Attheya_sp.AAC.1
MVLRATSILTEDARATAEYDCFLEINAMMNHGRAIPLLTQWWVMNCHIPGISVGLIFRDIVD